MLDLNLFEFAKWSATKYLSTRPEMSMCNGIPPIHSRQEQFSRKNDENNTITI